MRRFDVLAKKYNIDALYSGDTTSVVGTQQTYTNLLNSAQSLKFDSNSSSAGVTGNRQLVANGISSIRLSRIGSGVSHGYSTNLGNSQLGLSCIMDVISPGVWLFNFVVGSNFVGLFWNRKDQYTFYNIESGVQTSYIQSVDRSTKYISYQYDGVNSIITVNDNVYKYVTDSTVVSSINFAGPASDSTSTGSLLLDKLAISGSTSVLPLSLYSTLFKYNSLTNIYRPGDKSHFSYLFDSTTNKTIVLDGSTFGMLNSYRTASYSGVSTNNTYGLFSDAQFTAQVGAGASLASYPPQEYSRLTNTGPIIIQHTSTTDVPYKFIIVETGPIAPALLGADVTIAGPVYGARRPTRGYYLEKGFDTGLAVFTIVAQTGVTINSVEIMGQSSNLNTADITVNGAAPVGVLYTNGVVGNPKPYQFNHCVFVFTTAVSQFEITNAPMLTGFGTGDLAYSATDIKRIFDTYAGNTVQPSAEMIAKPVDGVLSNGPLTILNIKWSS